MSKRKSRGSVAYFTTLLSFFFGLSSFNALMLLTLNGINSTVQLSLISLEFGTFGVFDYFLVSLIATSAFLGATFYCLFRGLPADPNMLERLARVESSSATNTSMLENIQIGFFKRLEDNRENTELAIKKMNMQLEENDKGKRLALQKMNANIEQNMKMTNNALESHSRFLQEVQKENEKNVQTFTQQSKDFDKVKRKIEKIRRTLVPGKRKLTCNSDLGEIRGVNPSLAVGMRNMGINNVGQFLATDPATIAEKTNEFHEVINNLQGQAQLLMVPGVDVDEAELLTKVGITSRRELADQDPVELTRAIVSFVNVQTEGDSSYRVPTVDDVWSWIRSARR